MHRTPSIGDGAEMSELVNLIPSNGELVNIQEPVQVKNGDSPWLLPSNSELKTIHHTDQGDHYVYHVGLNVGYYNYPSTTSNNFLSLDSGEQLSSVTPIGNTLVVITDSRTIYFLWNGSEYKELGNGVPEINVRLGLKGQLGSATSKSRVMVVSSESQGSEYSQFMDPIYDSYSGSNHGTVYYSRTSEWDEDVYYTDFPLNQQATAGDMFRVTNNSADNMVVFLIKIVSGAMTFTQKTRIVIKSGESGEMSAEGGETRIAYHADRHHWKNNPTLLYVEKGTASTESVAIQKSQENFTAIMGAANEFISHTMSVEGRFIMPFYARVGLRLYSGDVTKLSAPILMIPNFGLTPKLFASVTSTGVTTPIIVGAVKASIQYYIEDAIPSEWSDIITGIVIAVTPPIYEYNEGHVYDENKDNFTSTIIRTPSGDYEEWDIDGYSIAEIPGAPAISYDDEGEAIYGHGLVKMNTLIKLLGLLASGTGENIPKYFRIDLPSFSREQINKSYVSFNQFRLLAEIKTSDIVTDEWVDIDTQNKDLYALLTGELIPDDSYSHNTQNGDLALAYNSKLHLAGRSETLWGGGDIFSMLGENANQPIESSRSGASTKNYYYVRVRTHLTRNNAEYIADTGLRGPFPNIDFKWFYYPDSSATSADILVGRSTSLITIGGGSYDDTGRISEYITASIPLYRHELLNGAYWFNGGNNIPFEKSSTTYTAWYEGSSYSVGSIATNAGKLWRCITAHTSGPTFDEPKWRVTTDDKLFQPIAENEVDNGNKLLISDVNNPFLMRESIYVGDGKILALSTSAKALSEGQFGEFPLYAFCSDGIWALSVGSDGHYTSVKPISRDVVTNPASICQLDEAVAFVTSQGLKIISGSETHLISEPIHGYNLPENIPAGLLTTLVNFNNNFIKDGSTAPVLADGRNFIDQVQTATILYDYAHNYLHVFPEPLASSRQMHYVYSFAEKEWSSQMLPFVVDRCIPGYPLSYMQSGRYLYQYKINISNKCRMGYAITRRNFLDDPNTMKAIYDVRTLGQATYHPTGTGENIYAKRIAIYYSNDGYNWTKLPSLKYGSAKYYRFVIMTSINDLDTISGMNVVYQERYKNKIR